MRFWRSKKSNRGTRRSTMRKRASSRLDFFFLWMRRFGIALGVIVFTLWVGVWLWLSGSIQSAGDRIKNNAIEMAADSGFTVKNILVEGRVNTDADVLLGIVNLQKGDPLFSFNPVEAGELIGRIAWVKSVKVERRLPDTIYIGLEERKPLALYQRKQKISLIDYDGDVITDYGLNRFKNLLIVTGENAPKNTYELVRILSAESQLMSHIEAASFVSKRRWNLKTKSGITIKLPAEDIGYALKRLAVLQEENQILSKDLQHIDLREPDRIVVQAAPGKVKEYSIKEFKAGYKSGNNI